jgi:hypothetical protein
MHLAVVAMNMVQVGFYFWTAVALSMILPLLSVSDQWKKVIAAYVVIIAVWLTYIIILSRSGILNDFSLPPRVPLFIVIPAVVIIILLTGGKNFKKILQQTPRHMPVYMQSFRIVVELLIYGAFLDGVFPEKATFKGLNYDILSGISALVVAFLYQKGRLSDKVILIWNVAALLILALTVYSFVSVYYFGDHVEAAGSTDFVKMPYLLLAAVLLPIAVFLHVFSLRQLLQYQNTFNKHE